MDPHIPSDSQSVKDAHKELRCNFSKKSLKRTKRKGYMHWQRALHIFWQNSNNEHEASCSITWLLFHFSTRIFSLYLLLCCLSKIALLALKYYQQIRLIEWKELNILIPGIYVSFKCKSLHRFLCIGNWIECKAHCYTSEDKMSLKA